MDCNTKKWNSQCEHGQPMGQTRGLFYTCDSGVARCLSLLVNESDVRSILHRQVSLAAVNRIYVIHKAVNGCKKPKKYLRLALKM